MKSATEWEIVLPLSSETQHFDIVGLDTDGNLAGMTGIGVTRTSETDFVRGDANADGSRTSVVDLGLRHGGGGAGFGQAVPLTDSTLQPITAALNDVGADRRCSREYLA